MQLHHTIARRLSLLSRVAFIATILLGAAACASGPAEAAPRSGRAQASAHSKRATTTKGSAVVLTNRLIDINEGINLGSIKKAQKKLLEYDSQSHEAIWLRINSPGGSVDAGLILVDTMAAVKSPIHCVVESKAYSMGAIILTFCDKRYGYPHSTYMLHEASYGTVGDDLSNRSKMEFLTSYLDKLHVQIAKRLNMSLKDYRAKIRDAWWLMADEALKVGLIEEVITDITFYVLPVQKTEEKRTATYTGPAAGAVHPGRRASGESAKAAPIPKRRD